MPLERQDELITPVGSESQRETDDRRPAPLGRIPIGAGLAAFTAAGGGSGAAMLEGAVFSGLMAAILWAATGMMAANYLTRPGTPPPHLGQTLRLVIAGSLGAVVIAVFSGGLAALLTAVLAALLGLLLVPSVALLIGARPLAGTGPQHAGTPGAPGDSSVPDGFDHRGYWQVNSALGGSGMWGYGFRRSYNPITGEAGEWLGPGLIRKSNDTIVRVDAKGRPT